MNLRSLAARSALFAVERLPQGKYGHPANMTRRNMPPRGPRPGTMNLCPTTSHPCALRQESGVGVARVVRARTDILRNCLWMCAAGERAQCRNCCRCSGRTARGVLASIRKQGPALPLCWRQHGSTCCRRTGSRHNRARFREDSSIQSNRPGLSFARAGHSLLSAIWSRKIDRSYGEQSPPLHATSRSSSHAGKLSHRADDGRRRPCK